MFCHCFATFQAVKTAGNTSRSFQLRPLKFFRPGQRFDKTLAFLPQKADTAWKESPCIPLPDPVRENEVKLTLQWSADDRTTRAIMRQAQLTGMTPDEYLRQALAAVIAGNEEDTFITEKEHFKIRADDAEKYVAAKLKGSLPDSIH